MSELAVLLGAVFAASVVGSLHCVGMCGGFVAAISGARAPGSCASAVPQPTSQRSWLARHSPVLAYQLSRGLAYSVLGALAGLLGAGLDASATLVGLQRLAGPLMGVTLIVMAVATLWPRKGEAPAQTLLALGGRPRKPPLLTRLRLHLTRAVGERGASAGAAAGLLTALLPCGWLWAYVVVAASTGSVGQGVMVMAAFWLGSVPALLGLGLVAGALGRRLGRHAPRITAAAMLTLGVLSLVGVLTPAPRQHHAQHQAPAADAPETDDASESSAAASLPASAPCH